jgi:hypothetical protein
VTAELTPTDWSPDEAVRLYLRLLRGTGPCREVTRVIEDIESELDAEAHRVSGRMSPAPRHP